MGSEGAIVMDCEGGRDGDCVSLKMDSAFAWHLLILLQAMEEDDDDIEKLKNYFSIIGFTFSFYKSFIYFSPYNLMR